MNELAKRVEVVVGLIFSYHVLVLGLVRTLIGEWNKLQVMLILL